MKERQLAFLMSLGVKPKGQGRPRFDPRSMRAYTPETTRKYIDMLKAEINRTWPNKPLSGAIAVSVEAIFNLPKRAGERPFHVQRPDADNIAKAVLDSLNGIVFADDAQVVELHATKVWAIDGDRLCVKVWSLA